MNQPTHQSVPLLRAVVIHGHAHGLAALEAARGARAQGSAAQLVLLSAPGAASFLGAGWWLALMEMLGSQIAACEAAQCLDCGAAAGRAMEALRLGLRWLILAAECPHYAAVSSRAAALGASLQSARPAALDLAERGAERRLRGWLQEGRVW